MVLRTLESFGDIILKEDNMALSKKLEEKINKFLKERNILHEEVIKSYETDLITYERLDEIMTKIHYGVSPGDKDKFIMKFIINNKDNESIMDFINEQSFPLTSKYKDFIVKKYRSKY